MERLHDTDDKYIFSEDDYKKNLKKLGLDYLLDANPKQQTNSQQPKPKQAQQDANPTTKDKTDTQQSKTPQTNQHSFLDWINLEQQTNQNKENKSINKEQIIQQFIQNNPKIEPPKKEESTSPPPKTITEPKKEYQEMVTETLAELYTQQKKYEEAIEVYKTLSLKYPEKSSYFANLIQNLYRVLENKK